MGAKRFFRYPSLKKVRDSCSFLDSYAALASYIEAGAVVFALTEPSFFNKLAAIEFKLNVNGAELSSHQEG